MAKKKSFFHPIGLICEELFRNSNDPIIPLDVLAIVEHLCDYQPESMRSVSLDELVNRASILVSPLHQPKQETPKKGEPILGQ